ncbi:MAG: hypothetical protein HYT80_00110 [Euryarchaeota archaeon]|nr:hypothetical protein [Euryarchaeota archaeon]
MRPLFITIVVAAVVAVAFSGCLEAKSTAYHAFGTKGSFAFGFAYGGGKTVQPLDAPVFLDVNDEANTGFLVVKGKAAGQDLEVHFDKFAPAKDFHDGGLAADFREHGASGTGDKTIPEVDLEMAGWGTATYKVGGAVQKDLGGNDRFAAHFMVIRNGVRDDATGAIWADANKTKPFNPLEPAMGLSVDGDWEFHLVLKNQTQNGTTGAAAPFGPMGFRGTPSNQITQTDRLFTTTVLGGTAWAYFNVTGTPTAAGNNVTFTIKSPSGATVLAQRVGAPTTPNPMNPQAAAQARYFKQVSFPVTEAGDYSVTTTGQITPQGAFEIRGVAIPPAAQVINFWWEELTFGADAEATAHDKGLIDEDHSHGGGNETADAARPRLR